MDAKGSSLSKRKTPAMPKAAPVAQPIARQSRGIERIEAILDAATKLIAEEGVSGVTMHRVASRARTSIGSMYHFFPDRDSVLQALVDRHALEMEEIGRQLTAMDDADWQRLSVAEVVHRLVTPYVNYFRNHRDYLPLLYSQTTPDSRVDFIHTLWHVLNIRLPALTSAECEAYAAVLHSMASGTVEMGFQIAPELIDFFLRETPRAMIAYWIDIEAKASRGNHSNRAKNAEKKRRSSAR